MGFVISLHAYARFLAVYNTTGFHRHHRCPNISVEDRFMSIIRHGQGSSKNINENYSPFVFKGGIPPPPPATHTRQCEEERRRKGKAECGICTSSSLLEPPTTKLLASCNNSNSSSINRPYRHHHHHYLSTSKLKYVHKSTSTEMY